ncbi:MAG: patatin-like phospholipase family protein, partial [Planctomycetota bacterium]
TWAARYPLLVATILIVLPLYAQVRRREFLVAITSHSWPGHAATVAMAWINGAIVALTLGILFRLGADRLDYTFTIGDVTVELLGQKFKRLDLYLPPLLALPTIYVLFRHARTWGAALLGTIAGVASGFVVSFIVVLVVVDDATPRPKWPEWFPDGAGYVVERRGTHAAGPAPVSTAAIGDGERPPRRRPRGDIVAPRHLLAATMLGVLLMIYAFGYVWLHPDRRRRSTPPLVFYLWFLLAIAALLLPGMAFFFDYYRAPVVGVLLAVSGVTAGLLGRDHFFHVHALKTPKLTVGQAIERRRQHMGPMEDDSPAVFACAAGGGIQAAAWTARVLTGLQETLGDSFPRALAMISGVSGGSVGALFWAHGVERERGFPHRDDLEKIFDLATRPSLDEAAWGLAFPDLLRGVFPPAATDIDRAWAVEQAWTRHLRRLALDMAGRAAGPTPDAESWRRGTAEGSLPILAFNTVTVEQGRHIVVSTAGLFHAGESSNDFESLYDDDLQPAPVTAARLSATFPFITPVARARRHDGPSDLAKWHFADGGYFDNGGVYTAVRSAAMWLEGHPKRRAVILEMEAFPAAPRTSPTTDFGWVRNSLAPMATLLSMRSSAQRERNRTEALLLEGAYPGRVERIVLQPRGGSPPLSWHLEPADIEAIRREWREIAASEDVERLKDLLS